MLTIAALPVDAAAFSYSLFIYKHRAALYRAHHTKYANA